MTAITVEDLKTYLKITNSLKDTLLSLLLSMAENKVLNKRYPFGYTDEQKTIALSKYADIVLDISIYLYNKRGGEGQTAHSENGISRSYEKAGIPDSYVSDIIPVASVRSYIIPEEETT